MTTTTTNSNTTTTARKRAYAKAYYQRTRGTQNKTPTTTNGVSPDGISKEVVSVTYPNGTSVRVFV